MNDIIKAWKSRQLAELGNLIGNVRAHVRDGLSSGDDEVTQEVAKTSRSLRVQQWSSSVLSNEETRNFFTGNGLFRTGISEMVNRIYRVCGEDAVDSGTGDFVSGLADGVVIDLMTEALRLTRDLCTSARGREIFRGMASELVQVLPKLDRLHRDNEFGQWNAKIVLFGSVLSTTICSICVQSQAVCEGLIESQESLRSVEEAFKFSLSIEDMTLRLCLMSLVYTLSVTASTESLHGLSRDKDMLRVILIAGGSTFNLVHHSESKGISKGTAEELHTTCIWFIGKMVNKGCGAQLIASIQFGDDKLKAVLMSLWLGHRLEEADEMDRTGINEAKVLDSDVESSFDALSQFFFEAVNLENGLSTLDVSCEELLLSIIGSYATDSRVYFSNPSKKNLIHAALRRLEYATKNQGSLPNGMRVKLVRIISNLCFKRPENQDEVRIAPHGLVTMLNQCNYDDNNQYLREWGIFSIRNLCEGNEDNQNAIAQLRIQGTINNSLIEKAGMRVELQADGRPKLVRL